MRYTAQQLSLLHSLSTLHVDRLWFISNDIKKYLSNSGVLGKLFDSKASEAIDMVGNQSDPAYWAKAKKVKDEKITIDLSEMLFPNVQGGVLAKTPHELSTDPFKLQFRSQFQRKLLGLSCEDWESFYQLDSSHADDRFIITNSGYTMCLVNVMNLGGRYLSLDGVIDKLVEIKAEEGGLQPTNKEHQKIKDIQSFAVKALYFVTTWNAIDRCKNEDEINFFFDGMADCHRDLYNLLDQLYSKYRIPDKSAYVQLKKLEQVEHALIQQTKAILLFDEIISSSPDLDYSDPKIVKEKIMAFLRDDPEREKIPNIQEILTAHAKEKAQSNPMRFLQMGSSPLVEYFDQWMEDFKLIERVVLPEQKEAALPRYKKLAELHLKLKEYCNHSSTLDREERAKKVQELQTLVAECVGNPGQAPLGFYKDALPRLQIEIQNELDFLKITIPSAVAHVHRDEKEDKTSEKDVRKPDELLQQSIWKHLSDRRLPWSETKEQVVEYANLVKFCRKNLIELKGNILTFLREKYKIDIIKENVKFDSRDYHAVLALSIIDQFLEKDMGERIQIKYVWSSEQNRYIVDEKSVPTESSIDPFVTDSVSGSQLDRDFEDEKSVSSDRQPIAQRYYNSKLNGNLMIEDYNAVLTALLAISKQSRRETLLSDKFSKRCMRPLKEALSNPQKRPKLFRTGRFSPAFSAEALDAEVSSAHQCKRSKGSKIMPHLVKSPRHYIKEITRSVFSQLFDLSLESKDIKSIVNFAITSLEMIEGINKEDPEIITQIEKVKAFVKGLGQVCECLDKVILDIANAKLKSDIVLLTINAKNLFDSQLSVHFAGAEQSDINTVKSKFVSLIENAKYQKLVQIDNKRLLFFKAVDKIYQDFRSYTPDTEVNLNEEYEKCRAIIATQDTFGCDPADEKAVRDDFSKQLSDLCLAKKNKLAKLKQDVKEIKQEVKQTKPDVKEPKQEVKEPKQKDVDQKSMTPTVVVHQAPTKEITEKKKDHKFSTRFFKPVKSVFQRITLLRKGKESDTAKIQLGEKELERRRNELHKLSGTKFFHLAEVTYLQVYQNYSLRKKGDPSAVETLLGIRNKLGLKTEDLHQKQKLNDQQIDKLNLLLDGLIRSKDIDEMKITDIKDISDLASRIDSFRAFYQVKRDGFVKGAIAEFLSQQDQIAAQFQNFYSALNQVQGIKENPTVFAKAYSAWRNWITSDKVQSNFPVSVKNDWIERAKLVYKLIIKNKIEKSFDLRNLKDTGKQEIEKIFAQLELDKEFSIKLEDFLTASSTMQSIKEGPHVEPLKIVIATVDDDKESKRSDAGVTTDTDPKEQFQKIQPGRLKRFLSIVPARLSPENPGLGLDSSSSPDSSPVSGPTSSPVTSPSPSPVPDSSSDSEDSDSKNSSPKRKWVGIFRSRTPESTQQIPQSQDQSQISLPTRLV